MAEVAYDENRIHPVGSSPISPMRVMTAAPSIVQFRENEMIYRAGETPRGIYVLRSGCVKISAPRECQRGRMTSPEFITRLIGVGEIFGFEAILRGRAHRQSAKALKAGEFELMRSSDLQGVLHGPPSVVQKVLRQMLREIDESSHREQLHYLASVQERIAAQLLSLSDSFGVTVPEGRSIHLKLTRNELAQLAGTINESLSRHLTEFRDEGLLELRGKEIIIKNRAALLAKAGHRSY